MAQAKRGRRSKELKFKIALEAIQGEKTVTQIAEEHGIHPN
jgi:transposase-like protein